ncbi:MAG: PAS domain-containing sensor histidine kinase [Pseudomonadota bacterium]
MSEVNSRVQDAARWVAGSLTDSWLARNSIVILVLLGPVLAFATTYVLSDDSGAVSPTLTKIVLLVDLCYVLTLVAVIAGRIGVLVLRRRDRSTGNRLHLRLAGVFAAVALLPTVLVAIFATLTLGIGLENLFSDRIGSVVRNSLTTAEAYQLEHRRKIRSDIFAMARDLNREASSGLTQQRLNDLVKQQALLRELPTAYVFTQAKEIIARGEFSYLFNFVPPSDAHLAAARRGEVVLIEDPANNEIRGLVYLPNFFDAFLYVSRTVQGDVLTLLRDTGQTVLFYERLERERGSVLVDYAIIYLGFALCVILAAIMLGLWFAERLARPVGRLAGAAELVGAGDLDVRVKEERGGDEIAMLSRVFNRMTGQLKGQRDALLQARDETESRRFFIEAVLSGVTAGVIGLDSTGRIELVNDAACQLLDIEADAANGQSLRRIAPGLAGVLEEARATGNAVARGQVRQVVEGENREFTARVAPKNPDDPDEGYVVTFDDVTALASAERMAAWGDVARRIAHEIKNPLTPIQLSADGMRRKLSKQFPGEGAAFDHYLDVITRQAGDIRRMVDEFAKFARMPEPAMAELDLGPLIDDTVLLQREARPGIDYKLKIPQEPAVINADRGLIGQVLTNLLQNAADAIEARVEQDGDAAPDPVVWLELEQGPRNWRLSITDSGVGLPEKERDRLTDPYVTTRAKGTGLGLAIVKKIIEQHGGELNLGNATSPDGPDGARITIRLPKPAVRAGSADEPASKEEAA